MSQEAEKGNACKYSSSLAIFMPYFACVKHLLITEQINTTTNVWTNLTLSPSPEITNSKIIPFPAFPIQIGHNTWTRMKHFFPHFYPITMIKDSSHTSHVTFISQL